MTKILYILAGIAAAFITILFINNILQYIAAGILGQYILKPEGFPYKVIVVPDVTNFAGGIIVYLVPLILSIIYIETALILFARKERLPEIPLILFIIINTGYIMYFVFYEVYSAVISYIPDSLTGLFPALTGSRNSLLIYMTIGSVFLFAYINIVLKRLKSSLPSVIQNKKGKLSDVKK